MDDLLWTPSDKRIETSLLADFARQNGQPIDYEAIHQWSVEDKASFWDAVWDFCGVVGEKGDVALVDETNTKEAKFFPDAKLNYAENLLCHGQDGPALIFRGENGARLEWSWTELRSTVSRLQQALTTMGIGQGDRVVAYVPHCPMTLAIMLAVTSLGAVWSSCSPDFGFNGVCDRFGQIEPKLLFTADAYFYNGKTHDSIATAMKISEAIPSIENVIVFPFTSSEIGSLPTGAVTMDECLDGFLPQDLTFNRVDFAAPLFVMFSSGTTGLPKCIVHGVGGTLLQHYKEHQLQSDLKPNDRLFYFTTCGWMMWNWQVSGLTSGATLVMYDGSPFYPDGNVLPNIIEEEHVTHFGTSAKYLDACAKAGIAPIKEQTFAQLRTIFSTGSPLSKEGFDYVYSDWKEDVCLASIAGGTDIMGCFVGGSPISAVYRGQCQKRMLGLDVRVVDDEMNELIGEQGELICAGPHPSQPIGFWNDPDGSRYHKAYFDRFPNVWHHGDFVELTQEGGMIFYGRSDAVLNPGGVRIGTAEIYRQVERVEDVLEGLVIGQRWDNDVRVILFVRLRDGLKLDADLTAKIKATIRQHATPRHVPAKVIQVADIPRTKSGKITELAVRDIVHGRPVKNTESMANPEALELYRDLAELQS